MFQSNYEYEFYLFCFEGVELGYEKECSMLLFIDKHDNTVVMEVLFISETYCERVELIAGIVEISGSIILADVRKSAGCKLKNGIK